MRLALVALSSAVVFLAGAWWLGRDAARAPRGESTTVEVVTPDDVESAAADPGAADRARSDAEPRGPRASATALEPPAAASPARAEIPEQWIPPEAEFAEAEIDGARTAASREISGDESDEGDAARDAPTPVRVAVDQEAWAQRIRRMLEVYRRVGPVR